MTPTKPTHPYHKQIALTLVVLVLGLATSCVVSSTRWWHVTFPGFVVLGNRVVASVDLPHWSVTQQPRDIYQKVVVAGERTRGRDLGGTLRPGTRVATRD